MIFQASCYKKTTLIFDVDLPLIKRHVSTLKCGYVFNVKIKTLIFQASWYKNKIVSESQPKINVVSTLNFGVDLTSINWRCFYVKIRLSFQRYYKVLIFQASWYKTKLCFKPKTHVVSTLNLIYESTLTNRHWINEDITLTDVTTLFQHISTLNQPWVFAGWSRDK